MKLILKIESTNIKGLNIQIDLSAEDIDSDITLGNFLTPHLSKLRESERNLSKWIIGSGKTIKF